MFKGAPLQDESSTSSLLMQLLHKGLDEKNVLIGPVPAYICILVGCTVTSTLVSTEMSKLSLVKTSILASVRSISTLPSRSHESHAAHLKHMIPAQSGQKNSVVQSWPRL